MFTQKDYALREDSQDEADPTEEKKDLLDLLDFAQREKRRKKAPPYGGAFVCLQDVPTGLLQLEVLLAVLDVDAAEGGRNLGAEVAAVDGEDAIV